MPDLGTVARSSMRRLFRRPGTPGTSPGTLLPQVGPAPPTRMRLIRYDEETLVELDLLDPAGLDEARDGAICWLDLEGHDVALVGELGKRLEIHPLALEDVVNVGQRPKIEDYANSLFIVLDLVRVDASGALCREQVSLVLQDALLMSVRENAATGSGEDIVEPIRARLRAGKGRIRSAGADYLAYAIIDTVVDHFFPVLEHLGERIEDVEDSLLDEPTREDLNSLHQLKRELLLLRRSAWPLRDALSSLLRLDSPLVHRETHVFLRDVADHVAVVIDVIETYREMVSSLVDLYLSAISNRMNEVMKVLTIIATIFIPLSFVAGLYGMNFDTSVSPFNMPELHWYFGYPVALLLMAAVAGGLLIFFRRKGWI